MIGMRRDEVRIGECIRAAGSVSGGDDVDNENAWGIDGNTINVCVIAVYCGTRISDHHPDNRHFRFNE